MKKVFVILAGCIFGLSSIALLLSADIPSQENITNGMQCYILSTQQDHALIKKHADIEFVYIPHDLKQAIQTLKERYTDLAALIDLSPLLDDATHIAPYETVKATIQKLAIILSSADIQTRNPEDVMLDIIQHYARLLESDNTQHALAELPELQEETEPHVRKIHSKTYYNLRVLNNTTTYTLNVAKQARFGGDLTVAGAISGTLPTLALQTTDHAVQVGNANGLLQSLPIGNNGQLLI